MQNLIDFSKPGDQDYIYADTNYFQVSVKNINFSYVLVELPSFPKYNTSDRE